MSHIMYIRPYDSYDSQGNPVYNHTGGFTVAYRVEETGDVVFCYTHCSKKDRFVKATGRTIALGRLALADDRTRDKVHTVNVGVSRPSIRDIRLEVMEFLSGLSKKYRKEIQLCREEP